ncbi:hypothetical protein C2I17_06330 [Niallia circulans]|jgi:hypothetical protein|uniref:Uncharacterized protein n=1 Tax=Niallia circulans TaxID=1397 RepID=A0AA91TTM1_NIACI|nr:hypothetical protein CHH57_10315 [Niallia circulans]UQZ74222.1 hypothetical protein C2I17_06330 [Niallia circulans]
METRCLEWKEPTQSRVGLYNNADSAKTVQMIIDTIKKEIKWSGNQLYPTCEKRFFITSLEALESRHSHGLSKP